MQWIRNGIETAWNIDYGPTGYTQGAGTTIQIVVNNPYTFTGLSPYITYDAYVQALCGQMLSNWAGPVTFSITSLSGDANCDGVVNVLDIITMINYIMTFNPTPFCLANADVNGDGAVNVLDVIGTINIIMAGGK